MKRFRFDVDGWRLCVSTWIENLFSVGRSALDSFASLDVVALRLAVDGEHRVKSRSRYYLPANPAEVLEAPWWNM